METLELDTALLVIALVLGALAVPITVIALHERRRRACERAAGLRRKEKIRL